MGWVWLSWLLIREKKSTLYPNNSWKRNLHASAAISTVAEPFALPPTRGSHAHWCPRTQWEAGRRLSLREARRRSSFLGWRSLPGFCFDRTSTSTNERMDEWLNGGKAVNNTLRWSSYEKWYPVPSIPHYIKTYIETPLASTIQEIIENIYIIDSPH